MKRPAHSKFLNHSFRSQSGQAAIEYILVIVISVTLLLSIVNQFFRPMQAFIRSYMGDYVGCLLETGELPSLGSAEASGECNARFEEASLARGRPPREGASGSNAKGSSAANRDRDQDSSESGGGTYAGSQGRRRSNLSGPPPRVGSAESRTPETKVVEISLGNTPEAGFSRSSGSSSSGSVSSSARGDEKTISYDLSASEVAKNENKKTNRSRTVATEMAGPAPKKFPIKPTSTAGKVSDTEIEEIGFGDYLRYILIAGIIIVIIALIGGQVARLSKAWEK